MEPAHRLHTMLHNGKDCWQHTDGETKRYYRLVVELFVGEMLAELGTRRASVTTGGPNVAYNADGWQNGASSRPSTAPPEPEVVELPVSDDVHPYGNPYNCPCPNEAPPEPEVVEPPEVPRYNVCDDCGQRHPAWISCEDEQRVATFNPK